LENVFHEFYKEAVTLYMGLLAQKVDKLIVTVRKLVHFCGDVPQFAFGADFAEINREYPEELFYQIVCRRDIGIEQGGNILLQEVCIPNKNSTDV
jgi:hypothetical protein